MAKISWNDFQQKLAQEEQNQSNYNPNGPRVGYFSLKNDGDEALIRIMHDSPEDFDLVTVHPVTIDGKFRSIACIRDAREPMEMCPFCAEGKKLSSKMYLHVIEYVKNDQNQIVAVPKVWERNATYAREIVNKINEYGPLSDVLLKVKRNGKAGSKDTTYSLDYALPTKYNPEWYPKDTTLFEGYQAEGRAVMKKSFEEMQKMVGTAQSTTYDNNPVAAPVPKGNVAPVAPVYQPQAPVATAPTYAQQTQPVQPVQAPVRTYREPTPMDTPVAPVYEAPAQAPVADYTNRPVYGQGQPDTTPATQPGGAQGARPRRFY